MENYKILAGKLNLIGERVNKSGLGFAYHNHDFEFIDHNGEWVLKPQYDGVKDFERLD